MGCPIWAALVLLVVLMSAYVWQQAGCWVYLGPADVPAGEGQGRHAPGEQPDTGLAC